MRAIVTGQIGMDKKRYLSAAADHSGQRGRPIEVFHVGDMMYAEARDVRPGRILDLPLSRLNALRRAAFKDIIAATSPPEQHPNVIVNTHATFRWRHGLFSAFDFDQIQKFQPNMMVCLVDNIEIVHQRLHAEHEIDATLKDCMVWREEEILATELMAQASGLQNQFYIVSRGRQTDSIETCARLITRGDVRKVYPSFPMTHVVDLPDVLAEIDRFRAELAKHFIAFDPGDVDEKLLLDRALAAASEGKDWVDVTPHSFGGRRDVKPIRVSVREVLDIAGDIDGQIYMRDFKLIDQADMICSLIPELPGGVPGLSSGVERELQHAWEHTKEVYVVWKPRKKPSPFITETATKIFPNVDDALAYFDAKGMFPERDLFWELSIMQPVQRIRTYVTLAVRATAVILILIGIYGLVQTALVWMWYGQVEISYDFGFTWVGHGLGYTISGVALAIASGPLVRWLVPVRRREYPQCGYALKNLKSQVCPECGYRLGSD